MTNEKPEVKKTDKVLIEAKQEHKNIYAALSAFQGELKPMAKNGRVQYDTNGGKKVDFNYTPLGDIMEAIYPLLKKHGLSVRHEISEAGIDAVVTHETYEYHPLFETNGAEVQISKEQGAGEHLSVTSGKIDILKMPPKNQIRSGVIKIKYGNEMKDTGAAITYAKRYTLTMALGISSEEDKDAELLEQSAKNAIQTVFMRLKSSLEQFKSVAEIEKSLAVIKKDIALISNNKAPALGLAKEQYEELVKLGESRISDIEADQTKN